MLRGNAGYDAAAVHLTGGGLADCRITGNSSAEGSGGGAVAIESATAVSLAIGTSWQVAIQAGLVAGTTTSGLQARASVRVPPMTTPYGEILVSGLRLVTVVAPSNGVQDLFSFALPNDLALVGILFYAQGFVAHPGALRLGNGLTVWIGE